MRVKLNSKPFPLKEALDWLTRGLMLLLLVIAIATILQINSKVARPLYYIEGNFIYDLGYNQFDTVRYESCKPYLFFEQAEKGLQNELADFYAEQYGFDIKPVKADLEIIEYR